MQLTTYLNNKAARAQASYFITPDVSFVIHTGKVYTDEDFNKAFPVSVHTIEFANCFKKGDNPNKRNLF